MFELYLLVFITYLLDVIHKSVYNKMSLVQGDEGPLGPPGNAGPTVGASRLAYSVYTSVHMVADRVAF